MKYALPFKSLGSVSFQEINNFIQHGYIKLISKFLKNNYFWRIETMKTGVIADKNAALQSQE